MADTATIEECLAARRGAALWDESARGRIRVAGADRVKFLQNVLTQDVKALAPGRGALACALTIKGKLVSDMRLFVREEEILLDVPEGRAPALVEHLRKFIVIAKVTVDDVSAELATLAVEGPEARAALERATGKPLPELEPLGTAALEGGAILARTSVSGAPGWRVIGAREAAEGLRAALEAAGARPISALAAEWLRVEGGTPLFGRDMDETTLPPEAGLEKSAISYNKGCYIGQETIARLHFLGHVNRRLMGLVFAGDGDAPPAGTLLFAADGKEIGRVTSPAWSAALGRPVALGIVRREASEPGTEVRAGSQDGRNAEIMALPLIAA